MALVALALAAGASKQSEKASSKADDELGSIRSVDPAYADRIEDLLRLGTSDALQALADGLDAGGFPELANRARRVAREREREAAAMKTPAGGAAPINRPDPSQAAAAPEVIGRTQRDPRVASLRNAVNARLVPRGFVPIAPGDTLDGPTCGALDALEASGLAAFGRSELERVFNVRLECTQRVAPEPFDGSSNVAQRWMMAVGSADISKMRDVAQGIATDSAITRRAVWSSSLAAIADELERNTRAALSS